MFGLLPHLEKQGAPFFFGSKWNEIVEIQSKTKTKRSETTKRKNEKKQKTEPKKLDAGIEPPERV
jgi:hypothetical protein